MLTFIDFILCSYVNILSYLRLGERLAIAARQFEVDPSAADCYSYKTKKPKTIGQEEIQFTPSDVDRLTTTGTITENLSR